MKVRPSIGERLHRPLERLVPNPKLKLVEQMTCQYLILFCWFVRHLESGICNCSLNTPISESCREFLIKRRPSFLKAARHFLQFVFTDSVA
jgi:hypothetical protein